MIFGWGCCTISVQRVGVEGGSSISADNLTLTHESRVSFATTIRYAGFVVQKEKKLLLTKIAFDNVFTKKELLEMWKRPVERQYTVAISKILEAIKLQTGTLLYHSVVVKIVL